MGVKGFEGPKAPRQFPNFCTTEYAQTPELVESLRPLYSTRVGGFDRPGSAKRPNVTWQLDTYKLLAGVVMEGFRLTL